MLFRSSIASHVDAHLPRYAILPNERGGSVAGLLERWPRVQDLLWPLAGFVLGSPEFKSSTTLVNSELVRLRPVGILNPFMLHMKYVESQLLVSCSFLSTSSSLALWVKDRTTCIIVGIIFLGRSLRCSVGDAGWPNYPIDAYRLLHVQPLLWSLECQTSCTKLRFHQGRVDC